MTRSVVKPSFVALCAVLLAAALAPVGARAETRTFSKTDILGPRSVAGTFGPANHYPSSIDVTGAPGTVKKATVTLLGLSSANGGDLDMVIEGPNGAEVMLMSDACGDPESSYRPNNWTFDDAAPTFLSKLSCGSEEQASFKPTNYFEESKPDDLSGEGGPEGPYRNALAFFEGSPADGEWNLFLFDDHEGFVGFRTSGWSLTLEIEPPPAAAPVPSPIPAPVLPVAAPVAPVAPTAVKTGKRAAALAKCKTKKTGKARRQCRRKAHKLPV